MFTKENNDFNNKNSRRSLEIGREKVAEAAFSYTRKFDDPRRNLSVNISSSFNYETENTDITTQSLYADNSFLGSALLQRTHNYQNSNVSNYKIDYTHPVSKKGTIETGYKAITRFTNADFKSLYYYHDSAYIENMRASNIFDFNEQIHAAYLQFRSVIGNPEDAKWKYDIGIRGEEVVNRGKTGTGLSYSRQYFNYFPTANLVYYMKPSDFLKLSFSRRINRPGLGQLNPFVDITDSLNQHGGNPYLKPELVNSLEAGYNKEWKKVSFSSSLFYRYSTNIIRPYLFLQSNGVVLTQPMNFGNATMYGFESIVSLYPFKNWSMNVSGSVFQQMIDGSNVSSDISNNILSWYGKVINNFTLWKGSKLQVLANYNSPIATPQGSRIAVYNVDMGFQQKMMHGKGGLGIVVTDVFNTQRSGLTAAAYDFNYKRTFKVDTRAVLVTFAYSFGTTFKESLMENKFSND
ncbi:MAG: outer membrane beta-barrel family protein, partial [Bacteroidia bacterium]